MANTYTGSDAGQAGLNVTEVDGSPNVFGVSKIIVSNGTLTDDGAGSVTITTGGGGGGSGTVTSVALSGGTTGLTVTGSPITTSGTITLAGTLAVANGGTGSSTASGARNSLGAAASGANSDITSLSGLTTPLSVAQGGTDATDAATALTNLGGLPLVASIATKNNTNDGEVIDPSLTGTVFICDTSAAGFILQLSAGDPDGTQYVFINSGGNPLTLEAVGGGGVNINGAGTYPITNQYQAATVIKQGVTWFAIG